MAKQQGFLTRMFDVDTISGMPEFSKILAFLCVIMLIVFESYALFALKQQFDVVAFAKAVSIMFGGLAVQLGVSEFFRQRFFKINGLPVPTEPPTTAPVTDATPAQQGESQ